MSELYFLIRIIVGIKVCLLKCTGEVPLAQQLLFDAKVTADVVDWWKQQQEGDVAASFVATNGGLTRVYPAE